MTHNMLSKCIKLHDTQCQENTAIFQIGLKIREMRNVFVKFDSTLFESKSVCHGMIMILFPFLAAKEKAFLTFIAKYNALHYYVYYLWVRIRRV